MEVIRTPYLGQTLVHDPSSTFHLTLNSQIAGEALTLYGALYDIERDVAGLTPGERHRLRQERASPAADTLHRWLILHRQKVPDGSATAKAIDYSLRRWSALLRYLDDGNLPIDNNWV